MWNAWRALRPFILLGLSGVAALAAPARYDVRSRIQSVQEYTHVLRWTDAIAARPAVQRGRKVNRPFGEPSSQLWERHEASDFDTKTQDKVAPPA